MAILNAYIRGKLDTDTNIKSHCSEEVEKNNSKTKHSNST